MTDSTPLTHIAGRIVVCAYVNDIGNDSKYRKLVARKFAKHLADSAEKLAIEYAMKRGFALRVVERDLRVENDITIVSFFCIPAGKERDLEYEIIEHLGEIDLDYEAEIFECKYN